LAQDEAWVPRAHAHVRSSSPGILLGCCAQVMQKVIECVPNHRIVGLLDTFLLCVVPLASHPFGCRIIQRMLEHVREPKRRGALLADVLAAAVSLTNDAMGNYVVRSAAGSKLVLTHACDREQDWRATPAATGAGHSGGIAEALHAPTWTRYRSRIASHHLSACFYCYTCMYVLGVCGSRLPVRVAPQVQHVLERGSPEERSAIAASLGPAVVGLSCHKYASNVVEKALTFGSSADREMLVSRMLGAAAVARALQQGGLDAAAGGLGGEPEDPLQAMAKDSFGNYVVSNAQRSGGGVLLSHSRKDPPGSRTPIATLWCRTTDLHFTQHPHTITNRTWTTS
jgi:hypothetical protein